MCFAMVRRTGMFRFIRPILICCEDRHRNLVGDHVIGDETAKQVREQGKTSK